MFGVAFVVALNLAARLDQPDLYRLEPADYVAERRRDGPGGAMNAARRPLTVIRKLRTSSTRRT